MATSVTVTSWDPLSNPECENCHGLSRPVRPKKKAPDCGLVTLKLSRKASLRRQLESLVRQAQIPRGRLAPCIFGMSAPKLWRLMKHGGIPDTNAQQISAMEYIKRKGSKVYVIYDIGALDWKWDATLKRRDHAAKIASCATTD